MPKKRTYNFKPLQGSTSSTNKQPTTPNANDGSSSVNERLGELRKVESKDAAARRRQLAESVNARSVPPTLHGILGVPESAPPKPKAHARMRDRIRTPGPAPPKSWLATSAAASKVEKYADKKERSRTKQLLRFARLTGLEGDSIDAKPSSLVHLALKTIAASWHLLDEEDYPALTDIPLRLRIRLLSYIDFYGSTISIAALRALLQGDEKVHCLDLVGLIGYGNLTLKRVGKLFDQKHHDKPSRHDESTVESWDAEETLKLQHEPLSTSRFSNLTHLCLSHPAATASWADLLAFSKHIQQVTHISLAYWPRPTLTPHLSTATVSSQSSPDVTAGGSHYYSGHDQDMEEPASLLRQLSGNLLCLQWLDLEGCEEWFPAMGRLDTTAGDLSSYAEWLEPSTSAQPVFVSNWKNLRFIRCAQGWLPSLSGIQGLAETREANVIDAMLVNGVTKYWEQQRDGEGPSIPATQDVFDVEKKKARLWLERESKMNYAYMRINNSRRGNGLQPIVADFGWVLRHTSHL